MRIAVNYWLNRLDGAIDLLDHDNWTGDLSQEATPYLHKWDRYQAI
jgi:hypothetical protein